MTKWTLFLIFLMAPIIGYSQLSESLKELKADPDPSFSNYEPLFFEATQYIFDNPVDFKSEEFVSALRIVDYWKNKDTGINVPIFGSFYESLNPKSNERYFYMIAITHYVLNEKINNGRYLRNTKIEGQKYSEQADVQESQLGGAKIFLDYVANQSNGLSLNPKARKYLKAHKKGNLEAIFFQ